MSHFRRLPPILRAASVFRLLLPLGIMASFILEATSRLWASPHSGVYVDRVAVIMLNLGVLGLSCYASVYAYNARFRQPDRRPFPLDSWQSQVRAILVPAAASICAVGLAVVIPPTTSAFQIVFPVSLIGVGLCFVFAYDERRVAGSRLTQPPRTE